jgi:hypothetical protein
MESRTVAPGEVRVGMVLLADGTTPALVLEVAGPVPAGTSLPRYTAVNLVTGERTVIRAPLSGGVEVLDLPRRMMEFVGCQEGDLLLLDFDEGQLHCVPITQTFAWQTFPPNTPVQVLVYQGVPVWVWGSLPSDAGPEV